MAAKSLASGTLCDDVVSLWGGSLAQNKLIVDFGAAAKASGLSSSEIAAALVTSANLTGAAMDKNMELGLMISSRRVSSRMAAHFAALVTEHVLKKI